MRERVLLAAVLFVAGLTTSFTFADSDSSTKAGVPESFTLPVVLKKTLDTAKVHVGDVVKFELMTPVIADHKVVIPANAKVFGRVITAHPLASNSLSSLAVVIESVEWKDHKLPLQGHLAGFGKFHLTYFGGKYKCNQGLADLDQPVRTTGRVRGDTNTPISSNPPKSVFSETQCDMVSAQSESSSKNTAHIRMYRTNSAEVPVAFVSTKQDIVLRKGTLLVIRNGAEPLTKGEASANNKMPQR